MLSSKKNERLFSVLFDQHYQKLYNYSLKVTKQEDISKDLVQETFIKLWDNFHIINTASRSIEAFLIVTLKRKIVDFYRKNKTQEKHLDIY